MTQCSAVQCKSPNWGPVVKGLGRLATCLQTRNGNLMFTCATDLDTLSPLWNTRAMEAIPSMDSFASADPSFVWWGGRSATNWGDLVTHPNHFSTQAKPFFNKIVNISQNSQVAIRNMKTDQNEYAAMSQKKVFPVPE